MTRRRPRSTLEGAGLLENRKLTAPFGQGSSQLKQ